MFERFTEPARLVVVFAQEEARALNHNYIGTEHVLLGLLREEEGLGARVLVSLDVSLAAVRDQVARIVGQGDELRTGQIPFTPRAKKVLELSLREALALGHNDIGTEHVLLGLVAEGDGVACQILLEFGVTPEALRDAVIRALSGADEPPEFTPSSPPLAAEAVEEIGRLAREKQAAVEGQRFEEAAAADERRRRLVRAARELERAWRNEPAVSGRRVQVHGPRGVRRSSPQVSRMPGRYSSFADPRRFGVSTALVLGWLLFAAALGIGIVIGWAIWA